MSFDWQTDEDHWDDEPIIVPAAPGRGRLRHLWLAALGLLLLAVVGWLFYRQVSAHLVTVETGVEDDVLASVRLLYLAATEQDAELLTSVLSGRDDRWVATQQILAQTGTLLSRPGLGLQLVAQEPTTDTTSISLSPDLTSAEVSSLVTYSFDVGNGLTDTVQLQLDTVYRLGPDRWLYAPGDPEAWGEMQTSEGRYVALVYPESDSEIAVRLLRDLDAKVAEMCAMQAGLNCLQDTPIWVRLSPNPGALQVEDSLRGLSLDQRELVLPAPALVGRPVDAAGYEALFRGYARQVLSHAFLGRVGWQCCAHAAMVQAILNDLLAELALAPRPLSRADYQAVLAQGTGLGEMFEVWALETPRPGPGDVLALQMVLAFLRQQQPQNGLPAMINRLGSAFSYWDWVRQFVPATVVDFTLEREWLRFLVDQAEGMALPPPIPWPAQDVLLLCDPGGQAEDGALYRFDPAGETLTPLPAAAGPYRALVPLPGRESAALLRVVPAPFNSSFITLSTWLDEPAAPQARWQSAVGEFLFLDDALAADGQTLFLTVRDQQLGQMVALAFDLAACAGSACEPQLLPGHAVWSPDGQHRLQLLPVSRPDARPGVQLADAGGQVLRDLGQGGTPFWLDDRTFGFVSQPVTGSEPVLLVGSLDDVALVNWLTGAEMLAALPDASFDQSYGVEKVLVQPANPAGLFLLVRRDNRALADLLAVTPPAGAATASAVWQLSVAGPLLPVASFSPDGRWLVVLGFDLAARRGELLLYDPAGEQAQRLGVHAAESGVAWSADGQWLVKADGGWLTLLQPDSGYQRSFVHDLVRCGPAGWVGKTSP
ncbi:MAG: hypothetical protein H6666_00415 [Ardenticatenaceae bacterium]|nr:hypothetical protein [Ardenticatenaceae bacterium]